MSVKSLVFSLLAILFWVGMEPLDAAQSRSEVKQAQLGLREKGYDPGPADGLLGPRTIDAIRKFQRTENLAVTGRLDRDTRVALGLDRSQAARSASRQVTELLLPRGTRIPTRLNEHLDSAKSQVGDTFTLTVSEDLVIDERVAIAEGSLIRGSLLEVQKAKRPQAGGKLVLRPDTLELQGEEIPLEGTITAPEARLEGRGSAKEDLKQIGIAAGVGAVVGGLIKGGKGALAGVLIGGGGAFLGTKGEEVRLSPEAELEVELSDDISVRAR